MTVTYQVVNLSTGGGSNNLLINPRGKINQANESDGVLSAGQYFCDGWKAGGAGAEVYRDSDGFRLISGSIVQLVPNNLDVGRQIRGNMDIISGTPIIRINGGGDDELSNTQPYITFEVVGDNSKFTRLVLAESVESPIYQQLKDELRPCLKFYTKKARILFNTVGHAYNNYLPYTIFIKETYLELMHKIPAVSLKVTSGENLDVTSYFLNAWITESGFVARNDFSSWLAESPDVFVEYVADARP
ncbi:hypothetical protein G6Z92_04840 [Vibrio aestuarianus subsp. cardii]|uniref:hypothetical protein n=1 Tax=Vibrio aestuarianus TaxID=28171 RepID=UPI0015C53A2A|nr:hypothetical protein [Vibrio aestuarianus]NGZ66313.1 hypothetical protein [Vibrio aestuarianus subsp. cardii]